MRRLIALLLGTACLVAVPAAAPAAEATCTRPVSDADALLLVGAFAHDPIWTLDDPHLTVLVLSEPNAPASNRMVISQAIADWNAVLQDCFDGALSITEVQGGPRDIASADVVLRYTVHRGGAAIAGSAVCLPSRCDVFVSSQAPPGQGGYTYSHQALYSTTQHEIGHVLGLGHATNLFESVTDVMAYGYGPEDEVPISQCNVDALAYIWSWHLDGGTTPVRPAKSEFAC